MAKKKKELDDQNLQELNSDIEINRLEKLYEDIKNVIDKARDNVYTTINSETVKGNWEIGKHILEEEQNGKERAEYGKQIIKYLSEKLTSSRGEGFTDRNLRNMRQFYSLFPIWHAVSAKLAWTHYRILLKVSNDKARNFYVHEAVKGRWGTRTLERAIYTKLYERTLMVQSNPEDVKDLVQDTMQNSNEIEFKPEEFIKDPYNLSFTGIKADSRYYEKELEQALIDKLQDFLIELGRGFAFVGRQYRITVDDENYYPDLVFYNYILKCFLIIDLKREKLTHQDIGQMDFYVRYFEKEIRMKNDNPTIGLILCSEKSNKMVKYTLLEDSKQIFASKYQLYLPTEEEFTKKISEEKERIELEQRLNKNENLDS